MGYALIIGGGLALLFFARGGGARSLGTIFSGLTHGTVKLGNLDPNFEPWLAQEMEKIFGPISGSAGNRQIDFDLLQTSIRNRRLGSIYRGAWTEGYWKSRPGDCGGFASPGGVQQIGLYSGVASRTADTLNSTLGLAGAAEQFANAVPIVGSIVSTITGIFSGVRAAHTHAVALEQATLCQAVPQINSFIGEIDRQFMAGQLSGTQAAQALETIYQQMQQGLAQIERPAGCNAACVYLRQLRGIVDAKTAFDY